MATITKSGIIPTTTTLSTSPKAAAVVLPLPSIKKTQSLWERFCSWVSKPKVPATVIPKEQSTLFAKYRNLLVKKQQEAANKTSPANISGHAKRAKLTPAQVDEINQKEAKARVCFRNPGVPDEDLFETPAEERTRKQMPNRITHNTTMINPNRTMQLAIDGKDYLLEVHVDSINERVTYCHPLTGRIQHMGLDS